MNNRNFIITIIVLALVAAASLASYLPARLDATAKTDVKKFPKEFSGWTGVDLPIDKRTYEILETTNLFVREYKNAGQESVWLYVIYSEDNRKVSHPPEVCFLGAGATIAQKEPVQVDSSVKASKLIVEGKDTVEMVLYWYKAGNFSTDQYLSQQLRVVMGRLLGKRTTCALIRLSTVVRDDNKKAAENLLKKFAMEIEPLLKTYAP